MLKVMAYGGLRVGEVVGLRARDLRREDGRRPSTAHETGGDAQRGPSACTAIGSTLRRRARPEPGDP